MKKSRNACCSWEQFEYSYRLALDHDPTDKEMKAAEKDWRHMNTGWEAAQIAMQPPEPEYKLKHLGGKHYEIL